MLTNPQEKLCNLFREVFHYREDEDFIFHIPVAQDILDKFVWLWPGDQRPSPQLSAGPLITLELSSYEVDYCQV